MVLTLSQVKVHLSENSTISLINLTPNHKGDSKETQELLFLKDHTKTMEEMSNRSLL